MTRAEQYVQDAWGNDGGAVEETARRGIASVDLADLRETYGDEADAVAEEIVAWCRARRPDAAERRGG